MADLDAAGLRAAVAAGVVDEAQASRLAALAQARAGYRDRFSGDEPFELFRGLNDVFVALGVALAGFGLWGAALFLGAQVSALAGGVGAWLLAEYLTRRRRMTLPSILLAIGVTLGAAGLAFSLLAPSGAQDGIGDAALIAGTALAAAAGALAFHLRFRLPFALFLTACALYLALVAAILPPDEGVLVLLSNAGDFGAFFDLGGSSVFALATLVFGLACFAAALAFDLRDPHRVGRLSACGFWLHLAAGPAIVNTVALSLARTPGAVAAAAFLGFLALIVVMALVIDRRSFLMAAAAYLASLVWGFAAERLQLGASGGLLALGLLVIFLGSFWTRLRSGLMTALPDFPGKDRLPPWGASVPAPPAGPPPA